MIPGGIGLQPGAQVLSQAQQVAQQAPAQLQEFEQILSSLEQSDRGGLAQEAARATASADAGPGQAKVVGPEKADELYARKLEEAQEPGGVRKLLTEAEAGTARLQDLIGQLQGGRVFKTQELIGMQAEIQQLSLQVETVTAVVGKVVSGVKDMLQQQI